MKKIISKVTPHVSNYAKLPRVTAIIKKDYGLLFENEVIKVKAGFMRHHLFPAQVAQYATKENLIQHEQSITDEQRQVLSEKKRGEVVRKRFAKVRTLVIFGNPKPLVGNQKFSRDIEPITREKLAQEIATQIGHVVPAKDVFLDDPIISIGSWEVPIRISRYIVTPLIFMVKTQQILDHLKSVQEVTTRQNNPELAAIDNAEIEMDDELEKKERQAAKQKKVDDRQKRRDGRKDDIQKRRSKRETKTESVPDQE